MRAQDALLIFASLLTLSSAVAQEPGEKKGDERQAWASPPQQHKVVRVLDADGNPLPAGTKLEVYIERYPSPGSQMWAVSGVGPTPSYPRVDAKGQLRLVRNGRGPANSRFGGVTWVQIQRTVAKEAAAAGPRIVTERERLAKLAGGAPLAARERAFVRWDAMGKVVRLRRAERLASGRVIDIRGGVVQIPTMSIAVTGEADSGLPVRSALAYTILPSIRTRDGKYEIWGWPQPGQYYLQARVTRELSSLRTPLHVGRRGQDLVVPEFGTLQCRMKSPKLFPRDAVKLVLQEVTHGGTKLRISMHPNNVHNQYLETGKYAMWIEVHGQQAHHFGWRWVRRGKRIDLAHSLEYRRILRIEVVDTKGAAIPASRVRVCGCPDAGEPTQRVLAGGASKRVHLIATQQESVDVEVSVFGSGYETKRVTKIRGDRRVTLAKK